MYRGNSRSHFSISTATQVVETRTLTSEKNQLLIIVANYLKKKSDRETTLKGLTSLEQTLAKSA
jgi:hypothetical protein